MSVTIIDKSSVDTPDYGNFNSDGESSDSNSPKANSVTRRAREVIQRTPIRKSPSKRSRTPEYPEYTPPKRSRSPEYPEPPSIFQLEPTSPEIKYISPVKYIFEKKNDTTIIIKKKMNRRSERRSMKCDDVDILAQLENSDDDGDDEEIFEARPKTRASRTPMKVEKTPAKKEISLKMKFRRSTEQSNYKVENVDESQSRRMSLRQIATTPSRHQSEDELKASRKQSGRSTKSVNHNETDENTCTPRRRPLRFARVDYYKPVEKEDNTPKKRSTRSSTKESSSSPKTPSNTPAKSQILNSNRSAARITRRTKISELDGGEMNKENKSENEEEKSPVINTPMKSMRLRMTPQKQRLLNEELTTTPRKMKNDVQTPRGTRLTRITEESPKKTPKKINQITDEPSTPRRKMPSTPKISNLTPSMRQRSVNIPKPRTILEEARAQLHVSAVPKSLPCREQEFNDVFTFLERKLLDQSGGCIYISGVPGTGKTATVNEVIRCLRKLVSKGALEEFDYVEINGMKLSEPRQAYVQILKQLTGKTATTEEARTLLEKRFTHRKTQGEMTLLLIDELDILCNKRQDVVYNLLDWPSKPNARLVVITIANTMDLPERVLMSRVTSRLGLTRLTFQPYNYKQLQEIVIARLNESEAFKSDAVQLVARKVAAVSGDARRALDICRRATEIAELYSSKIVSMAHVNEALGEMIASAKVRAIKFRSEMEKVFLQAVCTEIQRTGVEETNFLNVYKQLEALCALEGVKVPTVTESLGICSRLGATRLLLCEQSKWDVQQRIFLNVSPDDVYFALKEVEI